MLKAVHSFFKGNKNFRKLKNREREREIIVENFTLLNSGTFTFFLLPLESVKTKLGRYLQTISFPRKFYWEDNSKYFYLFCALIRYLAKSFFDLDIFTF